MPSSYTTNLGLEKPATGEQAGVWGTTANNDYDFIDRGIDGNLQIALSASTYNLNTAQGAESQGRYKVITWNGATAAATVNITPNTAQKIYYMINNTSFAISFQQGSGGVFILSANQSAIIYCDGAGPGARVSGANYNPQLGSVIVNGNLTVVGTVSFQQPATFTQPVTFSGAVTLGGAATVTGSLTLNLGGAAGAAYDLYYRSSGGPLARLPIGTPGQALTTQVGPTLAWATIGIQIGGTVVGSIPYSVYSANSGGALTQDTWVRVNPGTGLGLGVTPGHTLHLGYNYTPEIWLDTSNPAGTGQRMFVTATNGIPRWLLYNPAQTETGSGAGSNLNLVAYNDGGTATIQVMSWWRSNGNVSIGVYGDQGAKLAVFASVASQAPLVVRGVASQSYLQIWQDVNGNTMASIDGSGHLFLANANFLTTSFPTGRLDLYGAVSGHPWGTIHIGQEAGTPGDLRSTIAMEAASPQQPLAIPNGLIRFYHRNNNFVIQFYWNGLNYFVYLPLVGQTGPAQWYYTTTAV